MADLVIRRCNAHHKEFKGSFALSMPLSIADAVRKMYVHPRK